MVSTKAPTKPADAGPPLVVLLVEDEEEIRGLVRRYLEGHGMTVREANNGETAWGEMLRQTPDVLVTDIQLPRLSGRDLTDRVRKHMNLGTTPVVLMSASLLNAREEAALKAETKAEAVFRKPLPLRDVAATVMELGRSHRRAKAQRATPPNATPPPPGRTVTRTGVATPVASDSPARTGSGRLPAVAPPPHTPAPEPARPHHPPAATAAPAAGARTQSYGRMGAVTGDASPRALAAVANRAFQEHLDGVLEVLSGGHTRRILFHDGIVVGTSSTVEEERLGALLVESGLITLDQAADAHQLMTKEGVRFGFAVVRLVGLPPSAVAQALEEQTLWVSMQALSVRDGMWALKPMTENPVLAMQARLDPVEAVQRAALECLGSEEARELLLAAPGAKGGSLLRSQVFEERALSFSALRPTSALVGQLMDEPPLEDAITRAQAVTGGLNQLAALVLCGAFVIGEPGLEEPVPKRPAVLGSFGGRWRPPGLAQKDVELREEIAQEWLRSGGRKPHEILGVEPTATRDQVQGAMWTLSQKFGPPALDNQELGPAKRFLHVVRARFAEAARLMGG